MAKILLVEDDKSLSTQVREALAAEGYLVDGAYSVEEARGYIRMTPYDLIVLDWELPDGDGISICKSVRESKHKDVPIIFLTARAAISEKEIAFGSGGDDYLTKPFSLRELIIRVQALLRRPPGFQSRKLTIRDLTIDLDSHEVTAEGQKIELFPMEYALLEFLVLHPNQIFSAEALVSRVWPTDSESSIDSMRVTLMRVRQKLGDRNGKPLIVTLRGIGYRLEP